LNTEKILNVDAEITKDLTQATEVKVFQRGEEILPQGRQCLSFFAILSGEVILSRNGKRIGILGEHDIFGLESLLLKTPSSYRAEAAMECRVASYGPEALDHLIYNSPRMIQNLLASVVRQLALRTSNPLDFPPDYAADNARICFYKDGEVIYDEMSGGSDLYRLIASEGGLVISAGGQEICRIDKSGEFFGFPVSCAHASVQSVGESVVEKYCTDDLDILARDYPESAAQIMRMMIERLQNREPLTVHCE
jgi:hypothetical protein